MMKLPTPERNAEIYRRRCKGETLASISRDFQISRERVRQICFDQFVKARHNEKTAAGQIWPEDTELYDWIMYQSFENEYDIGTRTRAYNALRADYRHKHDRKGIPTVEYLMEMDPDDVKKVRGVGSLTASLIIDVRRKIREIQAVKSEQKLPDIDRLTFLGDDGNVHLRGTINKNAALCRLYAYENTQHSSCEIYDAEAEIGRLISFSYPARVMEYIELRGMLANEVVFVEFRERPELNGHHKWFDLSDIEHTAPEDYQVWWRAWTHEPDQMTMTGKAWKEPSK